MAADDYLKPDPDDDQYEGARKLIEAERKHLEQRPDPSGNLASGKLVGVALSGGGIRSATFSLGVLQALARHGWLRKVDYLSTVSGGGYIGSSLTWLLHKKWDLQPDSADESKRPFSTCQDAQGKLHFGVTADCFPYGTQRRGTAGAGAEKSVLLRFLRQHGNYLFPGRGITSASLLAVVLRGMVLNLLVYVPCLIGIFFLLQAAGGFGHCGSEFECWGGGGSLGAAGTRLNLLLCLAAGLAGVYLAFTVAYSLATFVAKESRDGGEWYRRRRSYEVWAGRLLRVTAILLLLGSLPLVAELIHRLGSGGLELGKVAAAVSAVAGMASGIAAFFKSGKREKGRVPLELLVWLGAALLSYGILLFSYQMAANVHHWESPQRLLAIVAAALLVGFFANINYLTVHRYYRDRLMEAYMPDVSLALQSELPPAKAADRAPLHTMCDYANGAPGPYHLINANLVLPDSRKAKFRGRGGDNFILSPLYCGSNASGWRKTEQFMGGKMALATAMAISGAAVNPDTGSGGEGPTRNLLLSWLMSLLNIRLGYWAAHPNPELQPRLAPNYFSPGLRELLVRRLDEQRPYLQLSDGGHFENLALYELIRRRLSVIVACDGAADPDFTFADFANLQEKVRADFGAKIEIDFKPLLPSVERAYPPGVKLAETGYVSGTITYADGSSGVLIYLSTTLVEGLTMDLYGYKCRCPDFPDQPTSDQFFDEKQFEAYRELGYQIANRMAQDADLRHQLQQQGVAM